MIMLYLIFYYNETNLPGSTCKTVASEAVDGEKWGVGARGAGEKGWAGRKTLFRVSSRV